MSKGLAALISTTEALPPKPSVYGWVPALELRHEPAVLGELAEVSEDGKLIGHWAVTNNQAVIDALQGRCVVMPRGWQDCARALRAVGADVTVHPFERNAVVLAKSRVGGIDYL